MSYRDKADIGLADEDLARAAGARFPSGLRVIMIVLGVLAIARLIWWLVR